MKKLIFAAAVLFTCTGALFAGYKSGGASASTGASDSVSVTVSTETHRMHAGGGVFASSSIFEAIPGLVYHVAGSTINLTGAEFYVVTSTSANSMTFNLAIRRSGAAGWTYAFGSNVTLPASARTTGMQATASVIVLYPGDEVALHVTSEPAGDKPEGFGAVMRTNRRLDQ